MYIYKFVLVPLVVKRKGWRMSLYLYRIKGKWTIRQPFNLINIWWWIYFYSYDFLSYIFLVVKRKGCPMSFYIIRIKGKWTIRQPFNIYICMTNIYFCSNDIRWNRCIIYFKFSPSFGRGAGLCRRCGLRGCIGGFGVSVKRCLL